MPAFLIRYPKGQGEDVYIEDDALQLDIVDGWAVFTDPIAPCLAIPASLGATIQRIDDPGAGQAKDETAHEGPAPEE